MRTAFLLLCQLALLTNSKALLNLNSLLPGVGSLASNILPVTKYVAPPVHADRPMDNGFARLTNKSIADIAEQFLLLNAPGVQQQIFTDVWFGGHKLIEIFEDQNMNVIKCNMLGDSTLIRGALQFVAETWVTKVTEKEMEHYPRLCDRTTPSAVVTYSIFSLINDIFNNLFILPGTKWCGAGNMAMNYDDLGSSRATDSCCREHDLAQDNITAFGVKHGIFNPNFYTMTNCEDDRRFRECLLANTAAQSATVGEIYFDILKTHCFEFTFPKTCVSENTIHGSEDTHQCTEYRLDTSQEKVWQTFEPSSFYWDYMERKEEQGSYHPPSDARPFLTSKTGFKDYYFNEEEEPFEESHVGEVRNSVDYISDYDMSPDVTEEPVWLYS